LILNDIALSDAQRREQFRAFLLNLAASRRIALFTLGPYAALRHALSLALRARGLR
jgi:hypothetical protein